MCLGHNLCFTTMSNRNKEKWKLRFSVMVQDGLYLWPASLLLSYWSPFTSNTLYRSITCTSEWNPMIQPTFGLDLQVTVPLFTNCHRASVGHNWPYQIQDKLLGKRADTHQNWWLFFHERYQTSNKSELLSHHTGWQEVRNSAPLGIPVLDSTARH